MLTAINQHVLLQRHELVSDVLLQNEPEYFVALVKLLDGYLRLSAPEASVDEEIARSSETFATATSDTIKKVWEDVLTQLVDAVAEAALTEEENSEAVEEKVEQKSRPVVYTKEELAMYFGVHYDTMDHWIAEGRFVGIRKKGPNQKLLIPETANFLTYSNTLLSVQWVVESYHQQRKEMGARDNMTKGELLKILKDEIKYYEELYGGPYDETLGTMIALTHIQQNDAELWQYFLYRIVEEEGDHA